MDRLTSMEIFVRVVDRGSLSAAAEASGLSTTMVSNHIRSLERRLDARLLNRTTRRQSLTEIGQTFYSECVTILERIGAAEAGARELRATPRGRLRLSAPTTLGSHLLVPLLAEYLRTYPDVEVELLLNDRIVDLVNEGFDAVLRFGKLADSGLVARPLRSFNRAMCASPRYLAQRGTPTTPADLTMHDCLAFFYLHAEREWHFGEPEDLDVSIKGPLTINNGSALHMAALCGVGIALLPDYLAAPDIEAGRLVRLFADHDFQRAPLQIVHLPDRYMTPKLRSFIDFITQKIGHGAGP